MAIDWDEIKRKAQARGAANEAQVAEIQARTLPKATLPTAQATLSKGTFGSVLDEYNTSLPGIGNQVAKALPTARKQEMAQGTQKFFEEAPVMAGFIQGSSLWNPLNATGNRLGVDIDTSKAEQSIPYKVGNIAGTMAQFAVPYAGAARSVSALPKVASAGNVIGQGISRVLPKASAQTAQKIGRGIAGSVATDLAVGLPLNVNYAFNKEGLRGTEALKSIGINTALDIAMGGALEAIGGVILKSGRKVASQADFEALTPIEKQEVQLLLTGPTEPQKLLTEGQNWGDPIRPDFYVTRGELPAFRLQQMGQAQTPPITPARAAESTVQPRNGNLGAVASQRQATPKTGPVAQKYKDLGADANRFEEVAMVMTDSSKAKPPVSERIGALAGNLKRKFVDSGDTVAKIGKINNDKGLYNLYNNAKQSRRRAEYHIGEAQTDINGREIGKPLKAIFDPIRKKGDNYYEDFQEYMFHLHNIDRMGFGEKAAEKLRQFEIEHQDLANLEDRQLREILKTADNDSAAVVKEYMKLIDDVNNAPSKPVFGKSITADESRKVSAYLRQQHPEFTQEAAEVRKYLDNLMEYRVQGGLVSRESADALADMYRNYVPTYRLNPSTRGLKTFGGNANITKGIKKATGSSKDLLPLHEQISKQTMQTVEAAHKNLFGQRLAANINPNTQRYIQELNKADDVFDVDADILPEMKNSFTVYENGQAFTMKVDEGLYEGIKALSESDPNTLVNAATAANTGFKQLITSWNPMFLIRNAARDIQDAGLYSKDLKNFAKMYPGAVKEMTTGGDLWKQYKALGGAGNSFFDYAKGYKKDPSLLKKNTIDRIEQLNMATEQLPRFTEFMATINKLGHQPNYDELMQAMYNAADVTVNFGRSGTWGKTLNRTFVPFFNPAMQGADKLIRRFAETKGVKGWTELVLKATALGVAPSLLNEMVYSNDPQYEVINDREKDINYLFKIGDNEWVKIPKGRVLSMFGSGAQRLYRASQGKEDAFAGYIKTMSDQVAPINPLTSNIAAPLMAVGTNRSWFGGKIEPQRLEKYSPGKRADESTTAFAKALGEKLNYSPKKIDYLADAYTGIIGDIAIPLSTPRAERNPFTKAFTIDSVTQNKISTQFYDKADEIKYAKNDVAGEDKYDVMSRYMNKQSDQVSELYDKIRKIENGLGTDSFKREKVREVRAIINGIEQTAMDTLPQFEKTAQRLLKKYSDTDVLYRETNKEVFGAEYALKTYNKDTYAKAQKFKGAGVSYDDFYKAYFATKDIESTKANGKSLEDVSKKKKAAIDSAFPNASREQLKLLYELAGVSQTIGHYRPQFD